MDNKKIVFGAITLILIINLFFGYSRLARYSAVDEPYWTYGRISKFWSGIKNQKWSRTNINDKPGVTVALVSGFGLWKIDPLLYESLRQEPKTGEQLETIKYINYIFRLPIYLFTLISIPLFYLLLKKILDAETALFSAIFIGLSPIILGMSLIINPDSLMWIFLPLSILSFFAYQKLDRKKYLYLSGFLLGLSLLTKYVANVLYVFFLGLIFLDYILGDKKDPVQKYLKKSLLDFGIIVLVSLTAFFVFFPATWTNPKLILEGTILSAGFKSVWPIFAGFLFFVSLDVFLLKARIFSRILEALKKHRSIIAKIIVGLFLLAVIFTFLNVYAGMKFFDFERILASPKGESKHFVFSVFSRKILADIYSLIFGLVPLAFVSFAVALVLFFRKNIISSYPAKIVFYLSLFILLYYFASTASDVVATVRYQIVLYPLAMIISGIGISVFYNFLKNNWQKYIFIVLVFLFSIASLILANPHFFTYASAFLPNKYVLNLKDMGDGSFEAAEFLNQLPNAKDMTIWSDKGAVCAVFSGKCHISFKPKEIASADFSYFVVSSGRKSRTLKLSSPVNDKFDFKKAYATDETVFEITMDGRPGNFVKIIDAGILERNKN